MLTIPSSELLKDKEIVAEINRHKWIQSEKQGQDIGFEKASRDWINNYAKQYLLEHPGKSAALWFKAQPIYTVLNKEIKL